MAFFGTRVLPVGNRYEATFTGHYKNSSYAFMARRMRDKFGLPLEVGDIIFESADYIVWVEVAGTRNPLAPALPRSLGEVMASRPPADGSCPFIDKLPAEIRRSILVDGLDSIPSKDQTISPTCGKVVACTSDRRKTSNSLTKVMLISKKIRDEITEVVYEERTFGIHVHQGFQNAGIEFLNVGRQPLQYLDHINDGRFARFRPDDLFGFCRLKRIEVHIFPYDGTHHHTAINTYFMNVALVRLLHRGTEKETDRITSIRIAFPEGDLLKHTGRSAVLAAGSSWWDADKDRPRESSIHGISDVELVLRPFAQLSHVHNVDVKLPMEVDRHVRTVGFVDTLQRYMTANVMQTPFNSDDLERKIESARFAHEDYVRKSMFGGTGADVSRVTDQELEDEKRSYNSDDEEGEDLDTVHQHDSSEHDDNLARMHSSRSAIERLVFDDDGGFLDGQDALDDDMPVAPNQTSEKAAMFVECFQVTGDVARTYLAMCEDDLERASHLFIAMPDVKEAAAAVFKHPPVSEGPLTPDKKGEKSSHHEAGDSDGWNKGKKGKGRLLIVLDDDDENTTDGHIADDEGAFQLKNIAHLRHFQQNAQQSNLQGSQQPQARFPRRLEDFDLNFTTSQSHVLPPGPIPLGNGGSIFGSLPSSNTVRDTSGAYLSSNDVSDLVGPRRTVVRRDSSAGTYSQQHGENIPPRVPGYTPYTSLPGLLLASSSQTAAHMRPEGINGRRTIQQRLRDFRNSHDTSSSPSRGRFPRRSVFPPSRVSSAFDNQQSQQHAYVSSNALQGSLQYAQATYRDSLQDGWSQDTWNTSAPGSAPYLYSTSDSQLPTMIQDNITWSQSAPWAGGSYYTDSDNVSTPIPAPYPSSSAPSTSQTLNGGLPFIDTSPLFSQGFAPGVPPPTRDNNDVFASQSYGISAGPNSNNNVARAPVQHSGLSAGLEGMGVDNAEESPPGGVPVDAEQVQDSRF